MAISVPEPTTAYLSGITEPSTSRTYIDGPSSSVPPTIVWVISGASRRLKSRFDMSLAADRTGIGLPTSRVNKFA